jgi:hypothetical protein
LPTRAERNEENIPETPGVWHDGHGENDYTLHGDGKVVDIPQNTITSHDDQQKHRRHGDPCQIRAKISVLIHKNLLPHKW